MSSGGKLTCQSTSDNLEWMLEKFFGDGKDTGDRDRLHVPIIGVNYMCMLACYLQHNSSVPIFVTWKIRVEFDWFKIATNESLPITLKSYFGMFYYEYLLNQV